jgi:aminodeoxyfutalosine synthase
MAGAETPQGMTEAALHRLIRQAGRVPVERDSLYRVLRNHGQPPAGGPPARLPISA